MTDAATRATRQFLRRYKSKVQQKLGTVLIELIPSPRKENIHQLVCTLRQAISKTSCSGGICTWSCKEVMPKSLRLAKMKSMQIMEAEEIGCKNGTRPISIGCSEDRCNYKCSREHMYFVMCSDQQIIHQEECSGGSCTWSCWNVIACRSEPEKVPGCSEINGTCTFKCAESLENIRCGEHDEPKKENCTGRNCSYVCSDVDSSVWDRV